MAYPPNASHTLSPIGRDMPGQRETEGTLRLISLAGSRSGLVGLLTVTHPLPSDTPGGRVGLCRGQRPSFRGRCAGGWGDVTHYLAG